MNLSMVSPCFRPMTAGRGSSRLLSPWAQLDGAHLDGWINELILRPTFTPSEQKKKKSAADLPFGHYIPSEFHQVISICCGPPAYSIEYQEVCCVCNDTFALSTMRSSGMAQMWWLTTPVVAVDKLWHFHRTPITHFAPGHFYWPCLCDIFTCDQWPTEQLINRTRTGSSKGFLTLLADGGWDKCSLRSHW